MRKILRGPWMFIVLLLAIVLIYTSASAGAAADKKTINYQPDFLAELKKDNVTNIVVIDDWAYGVYKDSNIKPDKLPGMFDFKARIPNTDIFEADRKELASTCEIEYRPLPETSWILQLLPYVVMIGVAIFILYMVMQQTQSSGGKVLQFGRSRARIALDEKRKVTFDAVAGADEEKDELKEIVEFLKNRKRFHDMGARIPKGVLLVGPPGTGKTLLAKAVAGEADVPFFSISGSDFVEMFVGVGASRVRDMFDTAKKNSPCIIFIDEIDAVGRHRGAGMGGGHDEREQTLNQLLVEMDGYTANEGIIILAATNRPDILDPALLRPGRFDRQITVHRPDAKGREEILAVHSKNKPLAKEITLNTIAKMTTGFTGADLENLLNEAAILAARADKKEIQMPELKEAVNRVIAGPEKRSRVVTDNDKRCTAYHEAGHALAAYYLPNCDPVEEVSVIPRGMAAGYTITLPKDDSTHIMKKKLLDDIAMMLGGRCAEKLVLDDVSTGAYNDLQRATDIARRMITEFGMSDALGNVFYGSKREHEVFLGMDYGHVSHLSEEITSKIDHEIRNIIDVAFGKVEVILKEHLDKLHEVVKVLFDREKLTREEFEAVMEGHGTYVLV